MYKHVIFDFDGTIADSSDIALQVYNEMARKYNYKERTMEELRELTTIPIQERLKQIGVPFYKIPQMSLECLARYRRFMHSLKAFDGIRDIAMFLKESGLTLSIISSNSVENIKHFLHKNELDIFDNVFSENNIFGKDKAIRKYLKQFGLKADEVLYIGDELRDIEACKRIHVKIISVIWGFDSTVLLQSAGPDYIAHAPEEIAEIIRSNEMLLGEC